MSSPLSRASAPEVQPHAPGPQSTTEQFRTTASLFVTKPLDRIIGEADSTGERTLKRVLGPGDLVALGIGAIIGTGIFVLTGQAAAAHAGPAIVLSMIVAGLASALAALCYSEFASTVPVAGSAYTYGYATLGEIVAWIIGWDLVLEYALGAATVAVGWSGYVVSLLSDFGITFPAVVSAAPGTVITLPDGATVTAMLNLPAILVAAAATILLVVGIRESATVNTVIVAIKVAVVLLVIGLGGLFINQVFWHPFIPENTGAFGEFGWSGIMRGAGVIFFAYIGFDAVSTAAQEAKHPQRDMPIGIIGSLVVCTVLYVLVSGVMVGLVPYQQLGVAAPMAVAVDAARQQSVGSSLEGVMTLMPSLVKLGAIAGLSSTIVVQMMAQPRIFLAMSKDGLLPAWASRIHPRFRTPHLTTIITGTTVALASGLTPIDVLGQLVSIGTLFAFVVVSIGVIVLRYKQPHLPRPFRTPFVPVLPVLSALVSFALMASLPWSTWERLLLWLAIGLGVYFAYGYRNSVVRRAREVS